MVPLKKITSIMRFFNILGARFGFRLDEELKKAASDDEVKAAIADKISRERIGHEVLLLFMNYKRWMLLALTLSCQS